jgi:hypothetical protein
MRIWDGIIEWKAEIADEMTDEGADSTEKLLYQRSGRPLIIDYTDFEYDHSCCP